jgi:uncharacterized protein (DUF2267 family)
MSATGLDVFDKTLQTTNIWLDQIMDEMGPDRQVAWHLLGATLRTLRDRLVLGLAAHLGSQLPLLVRGLYYDQWSPSGNPSDLHTADEFLAEVERSLGDIRPVSVRDGVRAVLRTVGDHVERGQIVKVCDALPKEIRALWPMQADTGKMPAKGKKPADKGPSAIVP